MVADLWGSFKPTFMSTKSQNNMTPTILHTFAYRIRCQINLMQLAALYEDRFFRKSKGAKAKAVR
jgi:hypothetical protein